MTLERRTLFVEVILPLAAPGTFTYRVPYELNGMVHVGQRAVVQFGKVRLYSGLIVSITEEVPSVDVKYIMELLDDVPLVNEIQLRFWCWISDYYLCHLGEVFQAALPSVLKLCSESSIALSDEFVLDAQSLSESEYLVVEALQIQPQLTVSLVSKIVGYKKVMPLIKSMIDKGYVVMEEELKGKYKAKYERFMRLSSRYTDEDELRDLMERLTKRAFKQLELLMVFISLGGSAVHELKAKDVLDKAGANSTLLKTMVDKGVFEVYEKKVSRLKSYQAQADVDAIVLTDAQNNALSSIREGFDKGKTVLLHGVTSSGKTEIYIKLIKEAIDAGKQVLYLLPEIALTAQIINRLKYYFGERVGVYHSRYGDNERAEVWEHVRAFDGRANAPQQIVIGSRSALFLPFSRLGLIIVDEEHDSSFKQSDPAPRYNARDASAILASLHKAKLLLGSATPSYESYYNAIQNRYHLVSLTQRYGGVEMPEMIISDMRSELKRKTVSANFGSVLMEVMKQTLEDKNQVILFQNRRGFSLRVECDVCHHIPQCVNCDVSLIYHKKLNILRCHYCGYTTPVPTQCPECLSPNIRMHGYGTERVEEDLKELFPDARSSRLDLDTTRLKNEYQNILEAFEEKSIDVLVGTQMVTKGLDFDSVKAVGILNADNMLSFPDFRAHERSFQLMSQVAGRAGRKGSKGKVVIQTFEPFHPVLQDVMRNDFVGLYEKQMMIRANYRYPPFYRLVLLRLKHSSYEKLNPAADDLAARLRPIFQHDMLGPEFPMVSRVKNMYIKHIMLKFRREHNAAKVKDIIMEQINLFQQQKEYKSVIVQIDVDPM